MSIALSGRMSDACAAASNKSPTLPNFGKDTWWRVAPRPEEATGTTVTAKVDVLHCFELCSGTFTDKIGSNTTDSNWQDGSGHVVVAFKKPTK